MNRQSPISHLSGIYSLPSNLIEFYLYPTVFLPVAVKVELLTKLLSGIRIV